MLRCVHEGVRAPIVNKGTRNLLDINHTTVTTMLSLIHLSYISLFPSCGEIKDSYKEDCCGKDAHLSFTNCVVPKTYPQQRAAIFLTSAAKGFYIQEAVHPIMMLEEAGIPYQVYSRTGVSTPQWLSIGPCIDLAAQTAPPSYHTYCDKASNDWYKMHEAKMVTNTALDDAGIASLADKTIFFFSGGSGATYDFNAPGYQLALSVAIDNGAIIAAACHGLAVFVGYHHGESTTPWIKNKYVTSFSTSEDEAAGEVSNQAVPGEFKNWNGTVNEGLVASGANYVEHGVFQSATVMVGKLLTCASQQSSVACAKHLLGLVESTMLGMDGMAHAMSGGKWY